jgi:hypothetical protein
MAHPTDHQLELLDPDDPRLDDGARFRFDTETRRRGLAHVAALRRQLAAQAQQRSTPPRAA